MHIAYNPELAAHTTHRTTPAPDPHQSAVRRMCHFCSAGLPPQCLVKLKFRYQLCIDTRIVQQPIMPSFRSHYALPHPWIVAAWLGYPDK